MLDLLIFRSHHTPMTSLRPRSTLFVALSFALLAAGCSSPQTAAVDEADIHASAEHEVTADDIAEGARPGPEVVSPQTVKDQAATQSEAAAEVPLNPMDRPTEHAALEFFIHSDLDTPALVPTQAYGQQWVAVEEGTELTMCAKNLASQAALVSLSIQGRDIDFNPAHPTRTLWRVEGQTTRCLTSGSKDKNYPAVVAWNAFFFMGEGGDGSQIEDPRAQAAASGFIRLDSPSPSERPNAWPALDAHEPQGSTLPPASQSPTQGQDGQG